MLVLILLASLGMPIGAQNIDNKGRVSGDSVTVSYTHLTLPTTERV